MAPAQNRTVYVTNTNQPAYRPQQVNGQQKIFFYSIGTIMCGIFLCFPGTFLTIDNSYVAGPLLISLGIVLVAIGAVVIGVACCKHHQAGLTGNVMVGQVVTTTVQQPYVVQQGDVAQKVNMQTNVHPTTTIYQAGQPQVTTTYQHQQGAQVPMPGPLGQGFSEPQITASFPQTNPGTAQGYPLNNLSNPPQDFSPVPPAYNNVIDTK